LFEYRFVENHHDHTLDRHHYEAQAGYLIGRAFSLSGSVEYTKAVDGIDWIDGLSTPEGIQENFHDHDAAAKEKAWRAGGSASWLARSNISLSLSYTGTLSGANTHGGYSVAFGPSWSFSTPLAR